MLEEKKYIYDELYSFLNFKYFLIQHQYDIIKKEKH